MTQVTAGNVSQGNNNGTTVLLSTTSASSGYAGASGGNNAGAAARIGALNIAAAGSAYFEFTLTPATGYAVSVSEIKFGSRSTGTAPQAYSVRSSKDSFATEVVGDTLANNSTWALKTGSISPVLTSEAGTELVIRIYGYNGAGNPGASTANWRIDDLQIALEATPAVDNNLYWDANGVVAGSGETPSGTWGVDEFWTSTADGTGTPGAWVVDQPAVFSAGSDAVGAYTITLSGAQSVAQVTFEDGLPLLTGGSLLLNSATPQLNVATTQATIASDITGTNGIAKAGTGTLILEGAKTFTGTVAVNAGVLRISEDGALGDAENDIVLAGTLATTQSLTLGAGRALTGGGALAPAPGTTLEVAGSMTMTGLAIADTGTVNLTGTTPTVGALSFTAPATLASSGAISASGLSASALTSGTSTVSAPLDFTPAGTATMTVNIGAGGQVTLAGALTKLSTGTTGRLSKQGAGTLRLEGANVEFSGVQLGVVGGAVGGTLVITNKDALGTRDTSLDEGVQYFQAQLNSGTLEVVGTLTGGNAVPNGISIGARVASPLVLTGGDVEFLGASSLFGAGTSGDIVVEVNNHVTLPGAFTQGGSVAITGLALSGTGTLTFANAETLLTSPLKLSGAVTVELDTATLGATNVAAPVHTLGAGTRLVIGTPGETRLVTAFGGINGEAGSAIEFDVDGLTRGVDYDALVLAKPDGAAGAVTFAGVIRVDFVGGFEAAIGDSFDLLDWDASVTPNFTGITFDLPDLPDGSEWNTTGFAASGVISVRSASTVDFTLSSEPQSLQRFVGQSASFTVVADGPGPFSYQWRKGTENLGDPTSDNFYTIASVVPGDEGTYFVDVTNASGMLSSSGAVLTVITPVQITQQPAPVSQTVIEGATVQITAVATGTGPISYNWRKGTESLGAPSLPSLTLTNVQIADSGSYNVIVTGPGLDNFEVSQNASLTVTPPPPPGPISITGNMTYSEDFDGMGTTTVATDYPNGWKGFKYLGTGTMPLGTVVTSTTNPAFTASTGNGTAGTIYNYGVAGAGLVTDRALGSQASGGFIGAFGVSFTNDTGVPLEGANIKLGFRSELWRTGSNALEERWIFEWKIGGEITDLDLGEWNTASAFDIIELNPTNTANTLRDGNAEGNFAVLSPAFLASLSGWEPGQVLHIRWRDVDNTGSDAGMAIDDFVFIAENVPPPPTLIYWDANGALAGAGGPTPAGAWGLDAFWNDLADGTGATAAWQAGADAIFSAGSDATGLFTVTVDGTQDIGALVFEEGQVTLSGGTLNFIDITPKVDVMAAAEATIHSLLSGSTGLLKRGEGTLSLTNSLNTFAGSIVLGGGILAVTEDAQLGDAANGIILSSGSLLTSVDFTLGAQRMLSGSGGVAPDAGTTLTLPGIVGTSALNITGAGVVNFTGTTPSVGTLTFQSATSTTGVELLALGIGANHGSGTSTIFNNLNFGNAIGTADVAAGATLVIDGNVSLGGGNRLVKTGEGTLAIKGAQPALNKVAIGFQGSAPVSGGVVLIDDKEGLGATEAFFNNGTIQAAVPLTGDDSIAVGLSIGGRDGNPAILAGEAMTFQGGVSFFTTASTGAIRLNVNNHTTFTGAVTGTINAGVSGFSVGGSGRLTLNNVLSTLSTGISLDDSVTVELAPTSFMGSPGVTAPPSITLASGTTLVVGLVGATQEVMSYSGLQGAAGSVLSFDIGGENQGQPSSGYDVLRLLKLTNEQAGPVAFAGQVKVALINGYIPELGDSFKILDWDASVTPDFTGISFDLPALGTGLAWSTASFAVDGTIRVATEFLSILNQPVSASVSPGQPVSFSVIASSPRVVSYQWQKKIGSIFEDVDAATLATLAFPSPTTNDTGIYRCVVSDGVSSLESTEVTLTVFPPITNVLVTRTPPKDYYLVGESVTLGATFDNTGGGTVSYRWFKGTTQVGTGATYAIPSLFLTDSGTYSVRVSTGGPEVASPGVQLVVVLPEPAIAVSPTPRTLVAVGQPITLSVTGTGRPPLRYQWKRDGKNIAGATRATLTLPRAVIAHAGSYTCEVNNATGPAALSSVAQVGVVTVNTNPPKLNLPVNGKSVMRVVAAGPGLTYAWTREGGAVSANFTTSVDGRTLNGSALTTADHGNYVCTVTLGTLTLAGGQHLLQVYDKAPVSPATTTMQDGIIGGNYYFEMPYTVGTPPTEAPDKFSVKGLPPGLRMDPKTGIITGRPTRAVTDAPITMTASNRLGKTETTSTLTIHPFPLKLAGVYVAAVLRDEELYGNLGGRLDMTITPVGAYSGSLTLGATKFPLKGLLDLDALDPNGLSGGTVPSFEVSIPQKISPAPLIVTVTLPILDGNGDPDANGERYIRGNVTDGTGDANFSGWLQKWNVRAGLPATDIQGYYTFGLMVPDADAALGNALVPQGSGFGSFTVAADGKYKFTGRTPDGEALTAAGIAGPGGEILLYQTFYRPAVGSILGVPVISSQGAATVQDRTLLGSVDWLRPETANVRHRLFRPGFGPQAMTVLGGRYFAPDVGKVLLNLDPDSQVSMKFFEGGIGTTFAGPLDQVSRVNMTLRIDAKNKLIPVTGPTAPDSNKPKAIPPRTGLFGGTMVLDDANPITGGKPARVKRSVPYQGILVKDGAGYVGYGYFLLPNLPSGAVTPPTTPTTSPIESGMVILQPLTP